MEIAGHAIGPGNAVFVIAETGVNHNGDSELARRLVDLAADAGADAIKFQTFKAEGVASAAAPKAAYQLETTDAGQSQLDMLRALELTPADHEMLQDHAGQRGIVFLSTPFDQESVDLLDRLDVPAFKLGSGEVTNLPFLEYVASKGRPLLLSTGMSYLEEVAAAVSTIQRAGCRDLALLHCVSNYPAAPKDINLRAMQTMTDAFQVPVGYSDHTPGIEVPLAAVALGACIIEKHFTLDRTLPGPDHRASIEPEELRALVDGVRAVESAMGDGIKAPTAAEEDTREIARRSLAAARTISEGTVLRAEMLTALRPGTGIAPARLNEAVGRKTRRDLSAGYIIQWSDLA